MRQEDYEKEPWTNYEYPIFTPIVLVVTFAGLLAFSTAITLLAHLGTSDVISAANVGATFLYATASFVCGWGLFSSSFAAGIQLEKWRQKREKRQRDERIQKVEG